MLRQLTATTKTVTKVQSAQIMFGNEGQDLYNIHKHSRKIRKVILYPIFSQLMDKCRSCIWKNMLRLASSFTHGQKVTVVHPFNPTYRLALDSTIPARQHIPAQLEKGEKISIMLQSLSPFSLSQHICTEVPG